MTKTSVIARLRVLTLFLAFSLQVGRGNATVLVPADLVDLRAIRARSFAVASLRSIRGGPKTGGRSRHS